MRKKYDYHLIISFNHLERDFNKYCRLHKNISFNRQARGFLLSKGIEYKFPWYELDLKNRNLEELIRIAKTPWLNEE